MSSLPAALHPHLQAVTPLTIIGHNIPFHSSLTENYISLNVLC